MSSFLGNIYLLPLDEKFASFGKRHDIKYFRYMDDVKVFAKGKSVARDSLFLMNEQLRSLRLNIQGAKTRILEGEDVRAELFHPELDAANKIIDKILHVKTLTVEQRRTFHKDLWFYVRTLGGRKRVLKERSFRLFRRLITAYTAIRHPALLSSVLKQMEQNPDARLTDKCISYIKRLPGNQTAASKRLASLLGKERELFPFQQASIIIALRYALTLDPNTLSLVWRLATIKSIHWHTRRQAALLLSMKDLDRNGLASAKRAFEKESNTEVKRAWVHCLTQLPRTELEEASRALAFSLHTKLQRLGQYLDALLSDQKLGLAEIESVFKENREDILIDRLYAIETVSKSKLRNVQSALLFSLTNNEIKFSRPLLKSRIEALKVQIKADLGGEQLGLL